MRQQGTTQSGLPDAKAFTHRLTEADTGPRLRKRWIMLLAIGTVALSCLFVWGFLHLILALVFPKPVIIH